MMKTIMQSESSQLNHKHSNLAVTRRNKNYNNHSAEASDETLWCEF